MNAEQLAAIEARTIDLAEVEDWVTSEVLETLTHWQRDIPALLDEIRNLREECRLADLDAKVNAATADRAEQAVERVQQVLHTKSFSEDGAGVRCVEVLDIRAALDPQEES